MTKTTTIIGLLIGMELGKRGGSEVWGGVVGVVVHQEDLTRVFDAAGRVDLAIDAGHGGVQHLQVGDARHLHVA